jgi:hypothetical protein
MTHLSKQSKATAEAVSQAGQMAATLSIALALRSDPKLREILAAAAGVSIGGLFAIGQRDRQPWLRVDGSSVTALREQPELLPTVDMAELLDSAGGIAYTLRKALESTPASADAAALINSLYGSELPDRETIRILHEWTPLLEQGAYGGSAAVLASLDDMRPRVLALAGSEKAPRDPDILSYWRQAHAMANLVLLATDTGAQPWLAEMAQQFAWTNWTPTYPLFRERSVWLAACAARSAAAFGESVVAKYLDALAAARNPFKAFDALFGLAAIGLAWSTSAPSILAELRLRRRLIELQSIPYGDIVSMAYDDAIAVLSGKGTAERQAVLEFAGIKWRSKSSRGLATREALSQDPAKFSDTGHFIGFAILSFALETPTENFYPQAVVPMPERQFGMWDAVEAVRRAWVA